MICNNRHVYELTSHIDILPTILDLANIDDNYTRNILHKTFSLAVPLSGKSLLPCILNNTYKTLPVYFYTEDNIFSGQRQQNILGKKYSDIKEPSCVEAIICYIDNTLWKLTNYYTLETFYIGQHNNILKNELYNLFNDPLELHNLYNNINYNQIQKYLNELLAHYSFRYREIANINV
jgi:choline-sulfatase